MGVKLDLELAAPSREFCQPRYEARALSYSLVTPSGGRMERH